MRRPLKIGVIILSILIVLGALAAYLSVQFAEHKIQREAKFIHFFFSREHGLGIKFKTNPKEGATHAYFYFHPFGYIEFEKVPSGA